MLDKLFQNLKQFKFKKAIYPALSGFFAAAAVAAFVYSALFLSSSINRVFESPEGAAEGRMIKIEKENYNLVAKKLGWPLLTE